MGKLSGSSIFWEAYRPFTMSFTHFRPFFVAKQPTHHKSLPPATPTNDDRMACISWVKNPIPRHALLPWSSAQRREAGNLVVGIERWWDDGWMIMWCHKWSQNEIFLGRDSSKSDSNSELRFRPDLFWFRGWLYGSHLHHTKHIWG